ncbi:hypothetical protein AKJ65_00815 [candidate division MSBL1 archaeon SCGC-AAA259E19]|uniref:Uncharacterized protein n=1 Tax=candidate division MSBL1 archaeon SCGC-AAA259E19 TaxID=1698264 RepID=A0A133UNF4_9EURY|nr:hypothetical protein AKJ65_00815 [candidate division MSBL1 archaeon SCGC-AAA259E19]
MMSIESLYPVVISAVFPLVLGLLIGAIVKSALKYLLGVLAVLAVAPYFGYEKLPKMGEFIDMAREGFGLGKDFYGFLPIHSGFFVVGAAIGFWKA